MIEQARALACDNAARVARRGLAPGSFKPPRHAGARPTHFKVIGPDSARAVILKAGNAIRTIQVHRNTYSHRAEAPITVERLYP